MHFNIKYLLSLLAVPTALAYIDQPCNGGSYGEGVCVKDTDCIMYGSQKGSAIKYAGSAPNWPCPNDPDNVICCIKKVTTLRSGQALGATGRCLNVSKCSTTFNTLINTYECPGTNNVKLCVPKSKTTTKKTTIKKTTTTTKKTTTIIKPTTFKQKEIIDISQWNVVTDYAAAAKEIDGVILRCGIRGYGSAGNLAKDDSLETHYNGFKGKTKIGYYFFTQAKTTAEAEAEATYVVNTLLKGKTNNFPIFWDSELSGASGNTGRADGLSKTTRTNCAVAFIKKIKALGYKAGVYASESWFRDNLDLKKLTDAGAYIWVAKYSSSSPSTSSYDAWQYTSSGSVKGINGNVDKSHVYKNIAGW